MAPATHGLLSWILGDLALRERRDRVLVTLAGLLPDVDGFGAVVEWWTRGSQRPLPWFSTYHHTFGHAAVSALVLTLVLTACARQRLRVALLALAAVHLHLLGDLAGARGPDGHQWPVRYLWPWSHDGWAWAGQWALNAWPNLLITGLAVLWVLYRGWSQGRTLLELVSQRADAALVGALRRRFGTPDHLA